MQYKLWNSIPQFFPAFWHFYSHFTIQMFSQPSTTQTFIIILPRNINYQHIILYILVFTSLDGWWEDGRFCIEWPRAFRDLPAVIYCLHECKLVYYCLNQHILHYHKQIFILKAAVRESWILFLYFMLFTGWTCENFTELPCKQSYFSVQYPPLLTVFIYLWKGQIFLLGKSCSPSPTAIGSQNSAVPCDYHKCVLKGFLLEKPHIMYSNGTRTGL